MSEPRPAKRVNRDFLVGLFSGVLVTLAALLIGAYVSWNLSGGGLLSKPDIPAEIPAAQSLGLDFSGAVWTPAGTPTPLAAFRDQAIFLCFFASWCPPCKTALPGIQRLRNRLKSTPGARILLISGEGSETVRDFLNRNGYDLPVYIEDGSISRRFGVEAIPVVFLLNRKGRVVFRHDGAARWDGDAVVEFIRKLAGEHP